MTFVLDKPRLIGAILYLVVDIVYVFSSTNAYASAMKAISGQSKTDGIVAYAPIAWVCMGLGWYFFAAPTALQWAIKTNPLAAGVASGLLFGITVIGTFNFTLTAMFSKWSQIMWRDMAWGISWATLSVTLYTLWASHNTKRGRKP